MRSEDSVSERPRSSRAYKERFDKDNFIKNLLLDNLLLVDIYNRAKKLHIDTEVKRVIFIIETPHEKDNAALENVRSLLGGKTKDFITAVDEKNIIVVKELSDKDGNKELEKMAKEMLDTLHGGEHPVCPRGTLILSKGISPKHKTILSSETMY